MKIGRNIHVDALTNQVAFKKAYFESVEKKNTKKQQQTKTHTFGCVFVSINETMVSKVTTDGKGLF